MTLSSAVDSKSPSTTSLPISSTSPASPSSSAASSDSNASSSAPVQRRIVAFLEEYKPKYQGGIFKKPVDGLRNITGANNELVETSDKVIAFLVKAGLIIGSVGLLIISGGIAGIPLYFFAIEWTKQGQFRKDFLLWRALNNAAFEKSEHNWRTERTVQNGRYNNLVERANAKIADVRVEVRTLEQAKAKAIIDPLNQELEKLRQAFEKDELGLLTRENRTLKASNDELAALSFTRQNTIDGLISEVGDLKQAAKDALKAHTVLVDNLNKTIDANNGEINSLKAKLEEARLQLQGAQGIAKAAQERVDAMKLLAEKGDVGAQKALELTQAVQDANQEVLKLQGQVDKLTTDLKSKEENRQEWVNYAKEQKHLLGQAERKITDLTQQINKLTTEQETTRVQHTAAIKAAQEKHTDLSKELEAANLKYTTLKGISEQAGKERDAFKDQLTAAEFRITFLGSEKTRLEKEIDTVKAAQKKAGEEYAQMLLNLTTECNDAKSALQEALVSNAELTTDNQRLTEEIASLNEEDSDGEGEVGKGDATVTVVNANAGNSLHMASLYEDDETTSDIPPPSSSSSALLDSPSISPLSFDKNSTGTISNFDSFFTNFSSSTLPSSSLGSSTQASESSSSSSARPATAFALKLPPLNLGSSSSSSSSSSISLDFSSSSSSSSSTASSSSAKVDDVKRPTARSFADVAKGNSTLQLPKAE